MNILLNNLVTLTAQPNEGNFHIIGVTGLGAADIRTSSFVFSGRDGGLVTDQLLGFRTIAVTGIIGSETREQHELDRQALNNAMTLGATFPVYIKNFAGKTYRIDCSLTDLKMEYKPRGYMTDFLLQLTAGDPYFYGVDGGDEQTATVLRAVEGGYITPYILPVVWEEGAAPTIVINSGDANYYPLITLYDEALNPSITNQATGETFAIDITMNDGDVVEIDMYNHTVKMNGADIIGNKTEDSVWWALLPGNNPILLNSDVSDDPVYAELTWRNGVKAI